MPRRPRGATVHQWIDSSFGTTPSASPAQTKQKPQKRKKADNDNECGLKRKSGGSSSAVWPQSEVTDSSQLAVSKPKLKQLDDWFRRQFLTNDQSSKFLLLNGPTGAGKTTSLKVLAKQYRVQVIEYKSYSQELEAVIDDECEEKLENYSNSSNQIENFKHFIANAVNYRNRLDFESSDGVMGNSSKAGDHRSGHRLVLIEEFPNVFVFKPEALHKELRLISKRFGKRLVPIVFIISETINGESLQYKLLPKGLAGELNMEIINFKPISETSLRASLQSQSDSQLSKEQIKALIDGASGDIRCAINNFQLLYMHSVDNNCDNNSGKKLRRVEQKAESNSAKSMASRDLSVNMLHAVGKVLYAKRLAPEDPSDRARPQSDSLYKLPQHLADKERAPLKDSPESIADKLVVSSDYFNQWLHQNYIDFCDGLESAQNCIDSLCESDALFSGIHHYNDKPFALLDAYKSSVAIAGLMFNLSSDKGSKDAKQQNSDSKPKHTFRPFRKPQSIVTNLMADSLKRQISESSAPMRHLCSSRSLVVDMLPFISQMPDRLANSDAAVKSVLNQIGTNKQNRKINEQDLCYALSHSSIANRFGETNDEIIFQTNTNDEQKDGNIVQIDWRPIDDNDYRVEDSDEDFDSDFEVNLSQVIESQVFI